MFDAYSVLYNQLKSWHSEENWSRTLVLKKKVLVDPKIFEKACGLGVNEKKWGLKWNLFHYLSVYSHAFEIWIHLFRAWFFCLNFRQFSKSRLFAYILWLIFPPLLWQVLSFKLQYRVCDAPCFKFTEPEVCYYNWKACENRAGIVLCKACIVSCEPWSERVTSVQRASETFLVRTCEACSHSFRNPFFNNTIWRPSGRTKCLLVQNKYYH